MPADQPSRAGRKPRADAERNRQRLLDAARSAFTAKGALVSMEEVARSAGVGIGTLYRHFPTRDELIVEVYRNEAAKLLEAARNLTESEAPLEAMRSWLLLFIDHLATKVILADAVRALVGDQAKDDAAATEQLGASLTLLMDRAIANGEIAATGVDPLDLVRAIYGVATASPSSDWDEAARRMVDILIIGLKAD
jgi:AcrR family transcriptional regulator